MKKKKTEKQITCPNCDLEISNDLIIDVEAVKGLHFRQVTEMHVR